jgi:very-short-patch-repair endonuclease
VVDPRWSAEGDSAAQWKHELFAALCSCPPKQRASAAVFRRSAAALWGLDGFVRGGVPLPVELAVTRGAGSSKGPYRLLRVRSFGPGDLAVFEGLPVTSVKRTLIDLGQVADSGLMERALESALRTSRVTVQELQATLQAVPALRGTRALRSLLAARPPGQVPTESDAETLFVQLVRRAGLPPPQRQFVVRTPEGDFRLDHAWPEVRVAVEIDGAATHASPAALARDLRRQNMILLALSLAGWVLLRFTWADLVCEPHTSQCIRRLHEAWSLGLSRH